MSLVQISAVLALFLATPAAKAPAETLFVGGVVAAGPDQTPQTNWAVLVRDGQITAVGPADDLKRDHAGAKIVDASTATILPGLADAHAHLYGLGLSLDTVSLVGLNSYAEAIAKVKERAAKAAPGEWILGRGWDQNRWEGKQFPTAAPLDAAIKDHPVWLRRVDGHAGVANSAAMKLAGVTRDTKDPQGGRIIRDKDGNPTGTFIDAAQELIDRKVPPPSFALRKQRVAAAAKSIAENGLVEIHDAGADSDTIRAVHELIDEGKFPIRVYQMLSDEPKLLDEWFAKGPQLGYKGRQTVRAVKMYADGALGSRGALLLQPYSDDPNNKGLVVSTVEHMSDVAKRAKAKGFQLATHAIGDGGVRNVVDSYKKADLSAADRPRIEHFQVTTPLDLNESSRMGIVSSMQPTPATSDMPWAEARLGPDRIHLAYAWRVMLNAGIPLAFGSDFPVESVNPFEGIYSGVNRRDHEGNPEDGWYRENWLSLPETLRAFTIGAAFAAYEEKSRGTIEPGKLADFTIVDGNFFTMPKKDLFKTKVKYTVVNGEIVYQAQ